MPVHEKAVGDSVEWYTPSHLFESLGITFDLDPASPESGPVPWIPARRFMSPTEDGLLERWKGRVWLNPPYGPVGQRFIEKMTEHRNGLLLIASRTETKAFQDAARASELVVFLRDRLHFVRPDGTSGRASFGSALIAYGRVSVEAARRADLGWSV